MATKDQKRLVRIDPKLDDDLTILAAIMNKPKYEVLEEATRDYIAAHNDIIRAKLQTFADCEHKPRLQAKEPPPPNLG